MPTGKHPLREHTWALLMMIHWVFCKEPREQRQHLRLLGFKTIWHLVAALGSPDSHTGEWIRERSRVLKWQQSSESTQQTHPALAAGLGATTGTHCWPNYRNTQRETDTETVLEKSYTLLLGSQKKSRMQKHLSSSHKIDHLAWSDAISGTRHPWNTGMVRLREGWLYALFHTLSHTSPRSSSAKNRTICQTDISLSLYHHLL